MTPSELLLDKIGRGFDQLDADGDGELGEQDHVLMGRRVAEALGYQPGSPEEQRMVDMYVRVWRDVHLPHLPAGITTIGRDDFISSTRDLAEDPAAADATLGALAREFLKIADVDADGRVTPAEFQAFQHGHFPALAEGDADTAFAHLDTDGDGYLSPDEFVRAVIEYWTSTDPDAPGNWWIGGPKPAR
ncbi:MAG: EF-hand domain-containing protein [Saccharothrix sp.]|nr:EF-hand domain-containing protein [Saccharothrix sp.]